MEQLSSKLNIPVFVYAHGIGHSLVISLTSFRCLNSTHVHMRKHIFKNACIRTYVSICQGVSMYECLGLWIFMCVCVFLCLSVRVETWHS